MPKCKARKGKAIILLSAHTTSPHLPLTEICFGQAINGQTKGTFITAKLASQVGGLESRIGQAIGWPEETLRRSQGLVVEALIREEIDAPVI